MKGGDSHEGVTAVDTLGKIMEEKTPDEEG
jgi:hypothetical protein